MLVALDLEGEEIGEWKGQSNDRTVTLNAIFAEDTIVAG
jgi:hypothetical protein